MGLTVCPDPQSAALRMADAIERAIRNNPYLKLGLATGRTAGASVSRARPSVSSRP